MPPMTHTTKTLHPRATQEWEARVPIPEGARFIIEFRPPREGEKFLSGDYIITSTVDWYAVHHPVIVGTITPA